MAAVVVVAAAPLLGCWMPLLLIRWEKAPDCWGTAALAAPETTEAYDDRRGTEEMLGPGRYEEEEDVGGAPPEPDGNGALVMLSSCAVMAGRAVAAEKDYHHPAVTPGHQIIQGIR
jgi:hypothetical protein